MNQPDYDRKRAKILLDYAWLHDALQLGDDVRITGIHCPPHNFEVEVLIEGDRFERVSLYDEATIVRLADAR